MPTQDMERFVELSHREEELDDEDVENENNNNENNNNDDTIDNDYYWTTIRSVRNDVNKCIEKMRNAKEVGASP